MKMRTRARLDLEGLEDRCLLSSISSITEFPLPSGSRLSSEGMIEGFSQGNDLLLVDYTGRLLREGKAAICTELAGILERLGSNAETWQARLRKLAGGRLLGRFFAASRARLRDVAGLLGEHHLANLGGCAAS